MCGRRWSRAEWTRTCVSCLTHVRRRACPGGWYEADDWCGSGGCVAGAFGLRAPEAGGASGCARSGNPEEREASNDSAVDHPWPTSATVNASERFQITKSTVIEVSPGQPDLQRIGKWIADLVAPALEASLTVRDGRAHRHPASSGSRSPAARPRAMTAISSPFRPRASASFRPRPRACFTACRRFGSSCRGRSSTRARVPSTSSCRRRKISDRPRFAWRGAMLDVARHFFGVDEVKRYIDLVALYKFNRLHLHLSDDQGWRIQIDVVAQPDDARREHRGRRRAGRLLHAGALRGARRLRARHGSSSSCPRSTCRATPTPRWRRIPS